MLFIIFHRATNSKIVSKVQTTIKIVFSSRNHALASVYLAIIQQKNLKLLISYNFDRKLNFCFIFFFHGTVLTMPLSSTAVCCQAAGDGAALVLISVYTGKESH